MCTVTAPELAGCPRARRLSARSPAWPPASDRGYPIRDRIARVVDGEIIWAPAIDDAFPLSTRGGDFEP
ncbi:encapsulin [Dactylosporangium sp. NPDC051484]|uniref:encapsulin n=1 Tax=Dactylosporangium sp. NPDC051484 TaxID=3154942 RepID=UPI00344BB83D